MFSPNIASLHIFLTLLYTLVHSSPIPIIQRDTAELYIFSNCINNYTSESYGAIFWYYPDFLPEYPEPQLTGYVSNYTAIQYAGRTTIVEYPFTLKAIIPASAETAAVGSLVSTNASASSFAGPMAVFKGSGLVFYSPGPHINCYENYYQHDVSCDETSKFYVY
jgi:hypothetical protein